MTLWHFTCDDAAPLIERDGALRPWPHPHLREAVVWATDLDAPPATILGLGNLSQHLTCDRMAHRFEVLDAGLFVPWCVYARRLPGGVRARLEGAAGALPRHWWLATERAPVRRCDRQRSPSFAGFGFTGSA